MSSSWQSTSVLPKNGFEAGTYYVFCAVTATAQDGRTATTVSQPIKLIFTPIVLDFSNGSGTETDPYMIYTQEDLEKIDNYVFNGQWCSGIYFKMANDITLTSNWDPIGGRNPNQANAGGDIQGFSGIFDGDGHKVTIAENGLPLFDYVSDVKIRNLNIYGKKIAGYGLIQNEKTDYGLDGNYWTGVPICGEITNVKLLSGSSTLKSGFMLGSGSGANTIYLKNCIIEPGVTIGYDYSQSDIGSFVGGAFNGQMTSCYSYATVYGISRVGGLAGSKGQSMGLCSFVNCGFSGDISATGNYVGGIIGSGYNSDSAPNTPPVSIQNCYVTGNITGGNYVGGTFGAEAGLKAAINPAYITDNVFYGSLKARDENGVVGGIMGFCLGINDNQHYENNYFYDSLGNATEVIGNVGTFNGFSDAELAAYKAKMGSAKTDSEMKDGSVVALLNASKSSFKNWIQGENGPILSSEPVVYQLEVNKDTIPQQYVGEAFNASGLTFVANVSDGTIKTVSAKDVELSGYDKTKHGTQVITATYGAAKAQFEIAVLKRDGGNITVTFSLLGDTSHGEPGETNTHTLADNNLTKWIDAVSYTVDANATVKDIIEKALAENHATCKNPDGNYIESITWNGTTLGEFDNGALSGWMYTIDGRHPDLGVNQQYLQDGNVIVLHYTDDYTKEAQDEGSGELPENKTDLTEAYTETAGYLAGAAEKNAPIVGSIGGEWMVIGLARDGKLTKNVADAYYANVEAYVKANINEKEQLHKNKSTDNARVILALTAMGKDVTNVQGHNLLAGFTDMAYISKQGINGPIWALIALDSHDYEIPESCKITRQQLVEAILAAQLSDGGWNLSGETADADVTAMALQALVPYTSDEKVMAAVEKGIDGLSELQLDNGGFGSWGTANSESCAQVIVALTALGIDPAADARFIKNDKTVLNAFAAFAVKDGFAHAADQNGNLQHNQMATEQAFYAMVAYNRFKSGENDLYNMLDVVLEKNTTEYPAEDPKDDPAPGVKEDLTEGISVAELNAAIQGKTEITVKAGDSTITLSAAVVKKLYETAPNAKLQIKVKALKVEELSTAEKATVSKLEGAMILDITAYLVEDGKDPIAVHELGGNVTVTAPYTQRVPVGKELVTYYIDSDGKQSDGIATTSANGLASFTTNHFSHYVIAQVDAPQAPVTGDSGHVLLWVTLMFAAGIGVVATTVLGKKRKYTR